MTSSSETFRVLLVGCGQLGSRHLQAISTLPDVRHVEVVDPRPEALALGQERLAAVSHRATGTSYRWLRSVDEASSAGDLCVVATQAAGRAALTRQVAEQLGYDVFLLEKVVSQSIAEYESLLQFITERGLSAWVNCKSRAYPFHKRAKELIDASEPVVLGEIGGNHGLANNGIHTADLFVFYDGVDQIDSGGSTIDSVVHSSKRGADVFDLTGTLHGWTNKGSQLTISFQGGHVAPPCMSLVTPRYRFVLDQMNRWAWESDAATGWQWRQTSFDGDLTVSHMSRAFIADILHTGVCELPTLADCLPAHRFVLGELLPHFRRLLSRQVDACPVT